MIDIEEFRSRVKSFPSKYMENFDYLWKWKIGIESKSTNHILDERHREETYRRLCVILPKWQTYRNGNNMSPLKTLKDSLDSISEAYSKIRSFTLLDFSEMNHGFLETVWHELGRVKEYNGNKNTYGYYSIISVCKPLLLFWGQTLAFDSYVRRHISSSFNVPRYSTRWNLEQWMQAIEEICKYLKNDQRCLEFIRKESEQRYGKNTIIPYGRFLDIYYWKGP